MVVDLTPYGYKKLDELSVVSSTGVAELDGKEKYTRMVSDSSEEEIVYSHDVLADIMLNGDKETSYKIVTEVDSKYAKGMMTEFYLQQRRSKRRMLLLARKTITRSSQKITKAIMENKVDMRIIKHEVEDFIKFKTDKRG